LVDDATGQMEVAIERGAEAVYEAHRAESGLADAAGLCVRKWNSESMWVASEFSNLFQVLPVCRIGHRLLCMFDALLSRRDSLRNNS
jgi:hypothetical protein